VLRGTARQTAPAFALPDSTRGSRSRGPRFSSPRCGHDLRAQSSASPTAVRESSPCRAADMRWKRLGVRRFPLGDEVRSNAFSISTKRRDVERFLQSSARSPSAAGESSSATSGCRSRGARGAIRRRRAHYAPRSVIYSDGRGPRRDGPVLGGASIRFAVRKVLLWRWRFVPLDGSEAWMTPLRAAAVIPGGELERRCSTTNGFLRISRGTYGGLLPRSARVDPPPRRR